MQLSEKEIEDLIYNDLVNQHGYGLKDRGLFINYTQFLHAEDDFIKCRWFRQLNIEPYGIADIVGFYRHSGILYVDLIELKAREIKYEDLEQISRYRKGIERYLKNTFKSVSICFSMYLIGTAYDGFYLQNLLPINIVSCHYSIHGIMFKDHSPYTGWYITEDKSKSFRDAKFNKTYGEAVH